MAKMLSDGKHKVTFVPTLVDYQAPSAAALNAGLDISCLVSMNNFTLGVSGENAIQDRALCSTSDDQAPGIKTYEAGMDFYRFDEPEADVAWATFVDSGISGFLVRRIGKRSQDPWVTGDEAQVYEVITGSPQVQTPSGGYEKFRQSFYIQGGKTDERAAVAA